MLADWFTTIPEQIRWLELLTSIGIAAASIVLRIAVTGWLMTFIVRKWVRSNYIAQWIASFRKPLGALIILSGFSIALHHYVPTNWEYNAVAQQITMSLAIIFIGWGLYNVSATSSSLFEDISRRFGLDESSMLIPFLSKLLRFLIVVLVIALVASDWGLNVNGVVAGMGIGSLAVALAAKDTLSNVIGGIVIITEKPFSKGDWIMTPSVEGFVEDITFRSSKIRTFADSIVTVPNATLATQPITNWSKMGKRRVNFSLGVALDSNPVSLERAVTRIEMELHMSDDVHQDLIMVRFNEFNAQSLGILVYFFTNTIVWAEHLRIRQEMNFMILQILEEEGIKLAYPLQRVFLEPAAAAAGTTMLEPVKKGSAS